MKNKTKRETPLELFNNKTLYADCHEYTIDEIFSEDEIEIIREALAEYERTNMKCYISEMYPEISKSARTSISNKVYNIIKAINDRSE